MTRQRPAGAANSPGVPIIDTDALDKARQEARVPETRAGRVPAQKNADSLSILIRRTL